jgi:hypothetical protein
VNCCAKSAPAVRSVGREERERERNSTVKFDVLKSVNKQMFDFVWCRAISEEKFFVLLHAIKEIKVLFMNGGCIGK